MRYETIRVAFDGDLCTIRLDRPRSDNTICQRLVEEFAHALQTCKAAAKVVIIEGSPEVFCLGADFREIHGRQCEGDGSGPQDPAPLYDIWSQLATGPYVSIAHVRGKVNAGGVGFVAACDVVLSETKAVFSLSELLFGLLPACVLPFLIRRVGVARANYMTLTTRPLSAVQAVEWGLVDACEENSEGLLRKHLVQLRRLSKDGIARSKSYMNDLCGELHACREKALQANREVFSNEGNLENISRYVRSGQFPWEASR
jgi:3-carboxymethyl-3-hydroxy-acyl-[acp] dehydratase